MWQYVIPAVATVVVAVVEAIAARERKAAKTDKEKQDARETRRAEESRLSMQMMSATLQLAVVTANALTGGHNNGNVQAAREAAHKAEVEYQAFLMRVAATEVSK